MNREAFLPFNYVGRFHRRHGWRMKPLDTLTFYTHGTPYWVRRLTSYIHGTPEDQSRLKITYSLIFEWRGASRVTVALHAMAGGFTLYPEFQIPPHSKITVSLKGEPFKVQGYRGASVGIMISGVKVFKAPKPKLNGAA